MVTTTQNLHPFEVEKLNSKSNYVNYLPSFRWKFFHYMIGKSEVSVYLHYLNITFKKKLYTALKLRNFSPFN